MSDPKAEPQKPDINGGSPAPGTDDAGDDVKPDDKDKN